MIGSNSRSKPTLLLFQNQLPEKQFFCYTINERSTKQFPKDQLFDLEAVLEQTEKGVEKDNLNPDLLKMAAFNFMPIFGPRALSNII